MTNDWYCRIDGTEHGPLSPQELKRMAKGGQLRPNDMVRKSETGKWLSASQIKGLVLETSPKAVAKEREKPADAPAQKKPKKVESNLASILLFGGGIALILLAAFAPLLTWISISAKEGETNVGNIAISGMGAVELRAGQSGDTKTDELSSASRPEGRLILGLCVLAALLLAAGFALAVSGVLQRKLAEQVLNGALLAGLAWAIFIIVWSVAWFWKTVTFSHGMRQGLEDVKLAIRTTELTFQPFPGMGLFLVTLAALLVAYMFSQVASRLNKQRHQMFRAEQLRGVSRQAVERLYMGRKQLLVAEGAGLLLGGLILLLVVQPWKADDLWKGVEPLALDLARRALAPGR